jgi:hypothetical protein
MVRQSAQHSIVPLVSQAARVTLLSHYVIVRFGSSSDRWSFRGHEVAWTTRAATIIKEYLS